MAVDFSEDDELFESDFESDDELFESDEPDEDEESVELFESDEPLALVDTFFPFEERLSVL